MDKSPCLCNLDPVFGSQQQYGDSTLSVTPVPGIQHAFPTFLHTKQAHGIYTYINLHIYKYKMHLIF